MSEFLVIITDIIIPVFIIIAIGYIMQRKFQMHVPTLAKINMYYLVPAFIFVKLYSTELSVQLFSNVILYFMLFIAVLYVGSFLIAHLIGLKNGKRITFSNSVILYNSGNYGVPVNELVFHADPFAASIQVIILTLQNILTFSFGVFSMQIVKVGLIKALLGYLKMPVLYAMLSGVIFNYMNVPLPNFVFVPANYIAEAMIGIALFTLGAQVAQINIRKGLSDVYISLILRLLAGPAVAVLIIWLLDIDGIFAQALLISSSMPTSVNSAIIAEEYDNYPGFAAQIVLFSTVFSSITVTLVIFIARFLF